MMEQLIIAGFGGQGVLTAGRLLAYAGMLENKNVSWLPSYGPEMRGGTANCNVIITEDLVGSPVVTQGTSVIVMNRPSLDKFEEFVEPGGMLFINSSIIDRKAERSDIKVFYVPANDIASELGNPKVANMVMLGAYLAMTGAVSLESVLDSLKSSLKGKEHLVEVNKQALIKGGESCK